MKESRNRDNNTKKTEYILNERCKFCKKKVVRNFGENRRELFQDFLSENTFPQNFCALNICDPNFCPHNIYDKSTPVDSAIADWKTSRGANLEREHQCGQ